MKVADGQIFNLMDTNGRRNDVINALQGYLTVLDNVQNEQKMEWASMPDSLAQYEFYRQALELSPEVFRQHQPYDRLLDELEKEAHLIERKRCGFWMSWKNIPILKTPWKTEIWTG